jgi:YidC/Oxa1 family membrane protein insertase
MDNRRLFLLGALGLVGYLIFNAWMHDYGPQRPARAPVAATTTAPAPASSVTAEGVPQVAAPGETRPAPPAQAPAVAHAQPLAQGRAVTVTTDVLRVTINTGGGDIRKVALLKYPASLKHPQQPVDLLTPDPENRLVLQSGLRGAGLPAHGAAYKAVADDYRLQPGQKTLRVPLTWREGGVTVTKTYTFERGSYQVGLGYRIVNDGQAPVKGAPYTQLRRHYVPHARHFLDVSRYTYSGPAYFNGSEYKKLDYKDLDKTPLAATASGGWAAMVDQYFVAAIIPPTKTGARYYTQALPGSRYLIGAVLPQFTLAPGAQTAVSERLFFGPKLQDRLKGIAPGLERTVDYGKFTIIAQPLFKVLEGIHWGVGNWGWSIILLVFLIKIVFFPLNQMAGRSMAKMREFQPRIKAIQERYKEDKQRLSQAMMELYKKEKINPMGGCLPTLLQVPIWFALYYVLLYSVELRQAPFVFWLRDLASPDPYYVLPILYGLAQLAQIRINPQPADKMQARIMMVMPFGVAIFALFMPAGLVVYWVTNSILTSLQQWHINRLIHQPKKKKK